MTSKLKTLEDLYDCEKGTEAKNICIACDEGLECDVKQIKAEAIKWVKTLDENHTIDGEEMKFREVFGKPQIWIKYFFNITEEELK